MQTQIKKKDTYEAGIDTLFDLRNQLMETLISFNVELGREDFDAIPFINADGYHNKTIAYSIWHIFRIEDIVAHTLISENEQMFFSGNYQKRINSPIITTGNELVKEQIADFSKRINLKELYLYIFLLYYYFIINQLILFILKIFLFFSLSQKVSFHTSFFSM